VDRVEKQAVLFDLDGTLIDPFVGIASAYHAMANDLGIADIPDETIRRVIGPPVQEALVLLGLPEDRLAEGVESFRRHYGSKGLHLFSAIPDIDAILSDLASDHVLCVATSKPRPFAIAILEEAGWAPIFSVVRGPSLDGRGRFKQDVIRGVLDELGPDAKPVAMVGDRAEDMSASAGLGITAIGVTWGFGSLDELVDAGASSVVDAPSQLAGLIRKLDDGNDA
jgi:phosphoglycolate phosphatase